MSNTISFLIGLVLAMSGSSVLAQPTDAADQVARKLNPYVYMRNAAGDKVFLETQIWRNDPNYDARALRRISDVMAGLEKLGFKGNPDAANGWDKFDLKKQMEKRGIPILEIDLEYGHPAGAQVKIRAEAFMEMLETRAN